MNKKVIALLAMAGILLVGCGKKDEAYYLSHKDAAAEKAEQCNKELEAAFVSADKDKIEALRRDTECEFATKAHRKHRRDAEEAEEQAREAERLAKIDAAKKEVAKKFEGQDWQKIATAYTNSECRDKWYSKDSSEVGCLAEDAFYAETAEKAKAELEKQGFEALMGQQKQYCSTDKRKYSPCYIWEQATGDQARAVFEKLEFAELEKQEKQYCDYSVQVGEVCNAWREVSREKEKAIVDKYVKNPDLLKRDYNQCFDRLQPLKNTYNFNKVAQITEHYPCEQVRDARSKLGLSYQFDERME